MKISIEFENCELKIGQIVFPVDFISGIISAVNALATWISRVIEYIQVPALMAILDEIEKGEA